MRISCDIGLPEALAGLEWHMEIEFLEEQLSGPPFYYLDLGGR
jgi:hypothetical protein